MVAFARCIRRELWCRAAGCAGGGVFLAACMKGVTLSTSVAYLVLVWPRRSHNVAHAPSFETRPQQVPKPQGCQPWRLNTEAVRRRSYEHNTSYHHFQNVQDVRMRHLPSSSRRHRNMNDPGHRNAIPLDQITPRATDLRWCDYPAGVGGHNAITTPGKSLSDRLSSLSEILFSDDIDLRIIDIRSKDGKYSSL